MITNAAEYRLGNWVRRPIKDYPEERRCIVNGHMILSWEKGKELRDYEPLPLTRILLARLGFSNVKDPFVNSAKWIHTWVYKVDIPGFKQEYTQSFELYWDEVGGHAMVCNASLGYVHQIQNLFFSLYRRELPYN